MDVRRIDVSISRNRQKKVGQKVKAYADGSKHSIYELQGLSQDCHSRPMVPFAKTT